MKGARFKALKSNFLERERTRFDPRMAKSMAPCSLKLLAIKEKTGVRISVETTKLNPRQLRRWFAKVPRKSQMESASEMHTGIIITSCLISSWVSPLLCAVLCFCSVLIPIISTPMFCSVTEHESSGLHRPLHCTPSSSYAHRTP